MIKITDLKEENERLRGLINSPELDDFIKGISLESAHQRERWGEESDIPPHHYIMVSNKLLGKMCVDIWDRNLEKYKHHLITIAAECFNVHRQIYKQGTAVNEWFSKTKR